MSPDLVRIEPPKKGLMRYPLIWLGLAHDNEIELESTRSASEIISSLASAIDKSPASWLAGASECKYIGSVTMRHFKIYCSSRGRDSWRPVLYGEIEEAPTGSKLKAHFEMHPLVKVGMAIWLLLVLSMAISFQDPFIKCWFLGMFLVGLAAGKIGSLFGENNRKDLIALLRQVAAASRIKTDSN